MNIFIMLGIIGANLIAIALIYQFIKKLPKMDKIIFIAACFGIAYALVSITYWISGFGIDSSINSAAKTFVTYLFVPVDLIILGPFLATKYNLWRQNKIKTREFAERVIKVLIVVIIILVCECFYFKSLQNNIVKVRDSLNETLENSDVNTEAESTNINEIQTNIIEDTNIVNETNTTENVNSEKLNSSNVQVHSNSEND